MNERPLIALSVLLIPLLAGCGGRGAGSPSTVPAPVASVPPASSAQPAQPAPTEPAPAPVAQRGCASDALGTARTLTLKREYTGYGKFHYGPLPLQKGEVVLTFDDGPVPAMIDKVLETLSTQCVKATFFMTGSNLARYPELGRRVVQAGHTPALHSFAHPALKSMSDADQMVDFEKGVQAFATVFGKAPDAYRFPFLDETPATLAALKERKMTVFSADMGIEDYYPNDMRTQAMAARLAAQLESNSSGILLIHDANGPTAQALPSLLKTIKDKGFKIVHVRWE